MKILLLISVIFLLLLIEYVSLKLNGLILNLTILFFSIAIGTLIFGQGVYSKWWIIDDHEIMLFLNGKEKVSISELPKKIVSTEAGSPGTSVRYRPAYYSLRMIESSFWGNNPFYWYLFRLLIIIFSIFSFWLFAGEIVGYGVSGSVVLYIFTYSFWADLISRLGPSETYCLLGLSMFAFGARLLLSKSMKVRILSAILILLGTLLTSGSKENFILVIIPLIYFLNNIRKEKSKNVFQISTLFVSIIFVIFVSISVFVSNIRLGSDVYNNPVDAVSRMQVLLAGINTGISKLVIWNSFVYLISFIAFRNSKDRIFSRNLFFLISIIWFMYLFNYVYYNGGWPLGNRYDFPFVLTPVVVALLSFKFIYQTYGIKYFREVTLKTLNIAIISIITFVALKYGYGKVISAVQDNVIRTRIFTNSINEFAYLLKADPNAELVVEVGEFFDYEPAVSFQRFFSNMGVKNKMFLKVNITDQFPQQNTKKMILAILNNISQNGYESFSPIYEFGNKRCYTIQLSGAYETKCKKLNVENISKYIK